MDSFPESSCSRDPAVIRDEPPREGRVIADKRKQSCSANAHLIVVVSLLGEFLSSHLVQTTHRVQAHRVLVLQSKRITLACLRPYRVTWAVMETTINPLIARMLKYLNDSQVAVLGVCTQVEDVPLHVHSG